MRFTIKSLLAAAAFLLIAGCASTATNIGNNLYRTSCGGMANGWSSCYDAARVQCSKGYKEQDRRQFNHPGQYNSLCLCMIYPIDRELIFSCS
tara:strand:+ start:918 stop:1196 length:279 start_codon:yes stop_codon:yes gene_type:complete